MAPLFRNYELVYGAGQFTWAGLWTVTDPPEDADAELAAAWELEDGSVSRWRLPVLPEARVLEVHRPAGWARLVAEHPRSAGGQEGWELPGLNQQRSAASMLVGVGGQRAARTEVRRHFGSRLALSRWRGAPSGRHRLWQ